MAEIRVNATGGLKLFDADDSHYAQIVAGTITSNTDVMTLGHAAVVMGTKLDMNGSNLILDADADTYLDTGTDDTIKVYVSGAHDLTIGANAINVLSGTTLTIDSGATIANSGTATGFSSADPASADGDTLGTASLEWSDLFLADGGIIKFGNDQDTLLTHTDGTGLTLNSTNKLCFNDATQFIQGASGTVLDIAATDEIELTATLIEAVGRLEVTGGAIFNEGSADVDFRVESNGNANMLVVNGGGDRVGIGADPDQSAGLHIKSADSGATANTAHDELVIEGSGDSGISILSGASSVGMVCFNDSGDTHEASVSYNHSDTSMKFVTAGATRMTVDGTGAVTKPMQPAFSVPLGSTVSNVTGDDTDYELNTTIWGTEIFDKNADLATTGIFTAPVTGLYQLTYHWEFYSITSVHTRGIISIKTSNRNYSMQINPYLVMEGSGNTDIGMSFTCLADMDASDTAYTSIKVFGNSKVIDLNGAASMWQGVLIA